MRAQGGPLVFQSFHASTNRRLERKGRTRHRNVRSSPGRYRQQQGGTGSCCRCVVEIATLDATRNAAKVSGGTLSNSVCLGAGYKPDREDSSFRIRPRFAYGGGGHDGNSGRDGQRAERQSRSLSPSLSNRRKRRTWSWRSCEEAERNRRVVCGCCSRPHAPAQGLVSSWGGAFGSGQSGTTEWYASLWQNDRLIAATWNSVEIAIITNIICLVLGSVSP